MRIVLALCVLVAATTANPQYGSGGGFPGNSGYYSAAELNAAAELSHRVANEKEFLIERVQMLIMQQNDLLGELDNIQNVVIPGFQSTQALQNGRLDAILAEIKELLHLLGDAESKLAGEVAVTNRLEALSRPFWDRIEALGESNNQQTALLAKIRVFLDEAEEKLDEKLESIAERTQDSIDANENNAKALQELTNTRQCAVEIVHVDIDYETGQGEGSVDLVVGAANSVPVTYCTMQGFVSSVNLDQTQPSYSYGYQYVGPQAVAAAIDCKPFADRVEVRAFDQSQGQGNAVSSIYVQVVACTFSAIS